MISPFKLMVGKKTLISCLSQGIHTNRENRLNQYSPLTPYLNGDEEISLLRYVIKEKKFSMAKKFIKKLLEQAKNIDQLSDVDTEELTLILSELENLSPQEGTIEHAILATLNGIKQLFNEYEVIEMPEVARLLEEGIENWDIIEINDLDYDVLSLENYDVEDETHTETPKHTDTASQTDPVNITPITTTTTTVEHIPLPTAINVNTNTIANVIQTPPAPHIQGETAPSPHGIDLL